MQFANELDKYSLYGVAKMDKDARTGRRGPAFWEFVACLLVPPFFFVLVFCLRSFSPHFQSGHGTDLICYCLLIVPLAFGVRAWTLSSIGDPKPAFLLSVLALLAWVSAMSMGDSNFHNNMKPYYDVKQLNTYPSVDPALYAGQSLMDAGVIEFMPGTKLLTHKSMGFKDDNVYCVAPIASAKGNQSTYDFWAVGMNCCSGQHPDFHCGEYSSTKSMKGLRLMDDDKREMYRLVVMKAQAEFKLKVSHPIFVYWVSDPNTEMHAYEDDGWRYFVTATFSFLCAQLLLIVCAAFSFAKI